MISTSELDYITKGISMQSRTDGRGLLSQRLYTLEKGLITQASGSAKLTHTTTQILVGIKASIQETVKGTVDVKIESSNFMDRQQDEKILLGYKKVIEQMGEYLDLNGLNIIPNVSWCIHIEVLILDYGGSVLDLIVYAVRSALEDTRIAKTMVEETDGLFDYEIGEESESLRLDNVPLCVSVSLVGGEMVVDCDTQEEQCAKSRINVLVDRKGTICGVFKEHGSFDPSVFKNVLDISADISKSMFEKL
jgi:exosome complex component RRP42